MPQHKSAEKRVRQSKVLYTRNRVQKNELYFMIKTLKKQIISKSSKGELDGLLRKIIQKLDRMSIKNVIHKNKASRKKSSLTKLVNNTLSSVEG